MSARVLVVDDDAQILRALRTSLVALGYEVVTAPNGETALEALATQAIDLVVLDLSLPGIGGHEVIARARGWTDVPIVILSVRESQADKVAALEAGADDYITKPFAIEELIARMHAVLRRTTPDQPGGSVLRFDELEVDLGRQRVRRSDTDVHLTPTEYRLLEALVTNPGKLLQHAWLLGKVWGPGYSTESHYLRVFVRQLRGKLADDPARPRYIATEPGLGYRWLPEPEQS